MGDSTHPGLSEEEIERRVVQIWHDILDPPDDSGDATFFESNGQSISAVQIVARLEEEIGVQFDMGDLFEDPDRETFVRDVIAKARSSGGDFVAPHTD